MITYKNLSNQPRAFLALTGLTPGEFGHLLPAFNSAYAHAYPTERTGAGQPRQRWPGAGRPSALARDEDKLLFLLVYLKTYPLQVVLGKLFGISTSQANYWLHHLLPVLRRALDQLGVLPERDGGRLGRRPAGAKGPGPLIIDGTERRRQRPKKPEKQALHYSGKKKAHTDKNVLVASARDQRVLFLSGTYAGKAHDKRIADVEGLTYPPGATLFKDAGFQGYEPPVHKTRQVKKKAAWARAYGGGEAGQPQVVEHPGPRGARHLRGEAQPHRQGCFSEHQGGVIRWVHGSRLRPS